VYYSLGGNTARVARDIARMTRADVEVLHDRDREHGVGYLGYVKAAIDALRERPATLGDLTRDPRNYSLTVIGTPVWAGRMTPAVRAYLQRFKGDLPRVAFFVTSGNTDASKIVLPMERIVGHKADAFAGFNAADLADPHKYEARVGAFVQALRRPALRSFVGVGSAA
jgi:hypothetical protein